MTSNATIMTPRPFTLSEALEDYLKTILALVRDHGFARVRDIAAARRVKAGSVTPALHRLADLGLVTYAQREYIKLTQNGEAEARRVLARHAILTRFFADVLRMAPDAAARDACSMEHSLSPEAMDRLTRLFESLQACRKNERSRPACLGECPLMRDGTDKRDLACECEPVDRKSATDGSLSLSKLKPGERARIMQVIAKGPTRQRLLDTGLLPDIVVQVERLAPTGDPIWISLDGSHLALRKSEAASVLVART
jgi:DtxR family Mn-dependent transcriptional regulator